MIDGSLSMTARREGGSDFSRAIAEARAAIDALGAGDAASLILAGPVPQGIVPAPLTDKAELRAALANLTPAGGSMRTADAIQAAAEASARAPDRPSRSSSSRTASVG